VRAASIAGSVLGLGDVVVGGAGVPIDVGLAASALVFIAHDRHLPIHWVGLRERGARIGKTIAEWTGRFRPRLRRCGVAACTEHSYVVDTYKRLSHLERHQSTGADAFR